MSILLLVITCLGGKFAINCPSAYLIILKSGNFKIFKHQDGDLSQKSPEPNMWLLVNHTEPTTGNYKSESGQLQNNAVKDVDYNQSCDFFVFCI